MSRPTSGSPAPSGRSPSISTLRWPRDRTRAPGPDAVQMMMQASGPVRPAGPFRGPGPPPGREGRQRGRILRPRGGQTWVRSTRSSRPGTGDDINAVVDFQIERVQLGDRATHGRGQPMPAECCLCLSLCSGPHSLGTLPCFGRVLITPPPCSAPSRPRPGFDQGRVVRVCRKSSRRFRLRGSLSWYGESGGDRGGIGREVRCVVPALGRASAPSGYRGGGAVTGPWQDPARRPRDWGA